ncbi:MAG: ribonuclease HI family protein [Candidatus Woesearchaeota archaeon]
MLPEVCINADGGARKNPGPAAIGFIICDKDRNSLEVHKECIGEATNNEAEYRALIKALQYATKHTRDTVQIFMDSELVIRQMNGKYKIKAQNLFTLFQEAKNREKSFKKVVYNYVTRNNKFQVQADKLVNEALDNL